MVLTEQELRSTKIFKTGSVPRPVLGLNCVGGESSSEQSKVLGKMTLSCNHDVIIIVIVFRTWSCYGHIWRNVKEASHSGHLSSHLQTDSVARKYY